ncbi:MAG: transposase [Blautia sp.]
MQECRLSTYQSGQLDNCYARMEKRGSRYLRYALFNATAYVCLWDPTYRLAYLAKKRAGRQALLCVAMSHATKKLVRLIYHLERTGQQYQKAI